MRGINLAINNFVYNMNKRFFKFILVLNLKKKLTSILTKLEICENSRTNLYSNLIPFMY